jgi:transcriptional regulator with XRE-family HTH domain
MSARTISSSIFEKRLMLCREYKSRDWDYDKIALLLGVSKKTIRNWECRLRRLRNSADRGG